MKKIQARTIAREVEKRGGTKSVPISKIEFPTAKPQPKNILQKEKIEGKSRYRRQPIEELDNYTEQNEAAVPDIKTITPPKPKPKVAVTLPPAAKLTKIPKSPRLPPKSPPKVKHNKPIPQGSGVCPVCGKQIKKDKKYCSRQCFYDRNK
jgi:hypothetical protein